MKNLPNIASILLLWMASQGASAYNYILCDDGITPLYAGQGVRTFQEGSNLFDSEVTATIQAFARLSAFSAGSATLVGPPDPAPALNNGQNEVWWDGTVPTAVCNTRYYVAPTCSVIESDIRIGAPTWYTVEDSNHTPYGDSGRSVQGVMVHEGGHCIGLGHTNNLYNIMGDERTHVNRNSTTTYYGPGEDASDGLIDLHGERSGGADTYRDVGVTTWRYSHASGAYSAHKMGRLLNSLGTELTKTGLQWYGQDEYIIDAGDGFQMEATYENNGEMTTESPAVSFYLSTNSIISTGDTLLLAPGNYTLGRATPFEYTQTGLTIPIGTPAGDYFVGVIVDSAYTIPETTDRNNYAHWPITVTDTEPPSPNPMTFSVFPHELNASQIAMTATTATDPSGGIQYYHQYTGSSTGGTGGTSSGWITSSSYTDSGLQPNEEYCYRVYAHDVYNNQTSPSAIDCDYTMANQPVPGSFSNITMTSIQVNLGSDGNPAGTEYWIRNATTGQFQSWSTSKTWVNTGLTCGTSYTFGAWSMNGDGTFASEVVLGNATTLPCPDADNDGIPDMSDNCTLVANTDQRDTNGDGYGNVCDTDMNQDLITNSLDVGILKQQFLTVGPDADFNGDAIVNSLDVGVLKQYFLSPPGPSCIDLPGGC